MYCLLSKKIIIKKKKNVKNKLKKHALMRDKIIVGVN